jgi:parallel beta-helix repeat protein
MKGVLLTVCLLVVFAGVGTAQPTISGAQSGTLGPGEYIVVGNLTIVNGASLTIEPGTTFLFGGNYEFLIDSDQTLIAVGTETDSIKFIPDTDGGVTQWKHLRFRDSAADDMLSYCLITGGSEVKGGGIYCANSSPSIGNSVIRGNSASDEGGGINCDGSNPTISNCIITANVANNRGGGINIEGSSSPTIQRCTITANTANLGAGIRTWNSDPMIVNTAITNNTGEGVFARDPSNPNIQYCNVYDNSAADFGGPGIDPALGLITGTNANGDPCDAYSNISLDPLYVDPGNGNFHLQETSPCIDAGSGRDPDDSHADIGAFYFHQDGFLAGVLSGFIGPGTFIVTGNLSIPECETLTIMPGTTLLFDGPYSFNIGYNRTLICVGTETDSIEFRPNTANGITRWGHLHFDHSQSDDILEYCLITGGYAAEYGGGIYCEQGSDPTIRNCTIRGNSAGEGGGGICLDGGSALIENCLIIDNDAYDGAAILGIASHETIRNCTIVGNTGIAAYYSLLSSPTIENCSITYNSRGISVHDYNGNPTIRYCNFYGNTHGNFDGFAANPNWGVIVGENVNGDPCDLYNNIFRNPLYIDRGNRNYRLQIESPCIDAGNPSSPLDPDGTVADIGAFHYDQTNGRIVISLEPTNPPVQIGAGGGVFAYSATVTNLALNQFTFDAWTEAVLPNGVVFGPIDTFTGITFPGHHSINPNLSQGVPSFAPAGMYVFRANVGTHPDIILSTDEFQFEKLAAAGPITVHEWASTGWGFDETVRDVASTPVDFELASAYPNPFNAFTTVTVALPEASELTVTVFNTLGQQVAELVNGRVNAGAQTLTYDASGLSSGIYFIHATVPGKLDAIQKVVLVR